MPKTTAFADQINELIFENTDAANVGDATGLQGSSTAGSFYIALFTADPTVSGSAANEADYTSYARVAVARSTAGWTTTNGATVNDAEIAFPQSTGGSNTVTYFGICKADVEGVADIIEYAALTASRAIASGDTPTFAAGDLTSTEA